ncbi:DEAD/DEAH box helicase [Herbidospora galbida]|uniref:DEAD/DEAH box helicase n=1 Tax=Herbidospora galbida TaxID=2575442 RepID=A0A4U3M6W2_9ACTN|nr:DEAD/DEAH box helicase [Herbidospora galbida]TKK84675.1 DEAD/DEAH box helicase [Herbidospora galbida]
MLTVDLRDYQTPALAQFTAHGRLLLTMEMGVGKTVTALACAEYLLAEGLVTTVIIAVPKALLTQWGQAIAETTDVSCSVRVSRDGKRTLWPDKEWGVIIDGSPTVKARLLDEAITNQTDYILATHDFVASNARKIKKGIPDALLIIDEVSVLKGWKSKRAKALRRLQTPYRIGLTGTPVENRLEEALAISEWVAPGHFGTYRDFEDSFVRRNRWGRVLRYVNLATFRRKWLEISYRKRQSDPDVAPYMPSVVHERWLAPITPALRTVYEDVLHDLAAELNNLADPGDFDPEAYYGGESDAVGAGKVQAIHTTISMLLCHPLLVVRAAERGTNAYALKIVASGRLAPVTDLHMQPKLDELRRRVIPLLDMPEHKIIIVSRYVHMLDLIAGAFPSHRSVIYSGEITSLAKRQQLIDEFKFDPDCRLLLMSHAGAYGLDLPEATHLIHYDAPRSHGQYVQISARHVRASSKHDQVAVIDLVTPGTIEERAFDALSFKTRVADASIDGEGIDTSGGLDNDVISLSAHVRGALTESS